MNDERHRPATEEDTSHTTPEPSHRAAPWLRIGRMLLAPALAAAAVGVHFTLNVPAADIRQSLKEQGRVNPRGKSTAKPSSTSRSAVKRSESELAELFERYRKVAFEQEPVLAAWARAHHPFVNKVVAVARRHAFEGAPEDPRVSMSATQCRTIRCRFVLRSPYPHELELLDRTLRTLRTSKGPLWRHYESSPIDRPSNDGDAHLQVIVAWSTDAPDVKSIEVSGTEE